MSEIMEDDSQLCNHSFKNFKCEQPKDHTGMHRFYEETSSTSDETNFTLHKWDDSMEVGK